MTTEPNTDLLVRIHTTYKTPDRRHIASLPKPTRRNATKGDCNVCGGFHGLPAVHLDYMGHAEVTDALLTEDPTWNWEPLALDESGLPMVYHVGDQDRPDLVMWIRLTIGGMTRLGVGTAPSFKGGDAIKELIGDAIRNAAMRFGIALDLWSKAEGVDNTLEAGRSVTPDALMLPDGFEPYEGVWTRDVVRDMNRPTLIAELNVRDVWPSDEWKDDGLRRRLWELVEPPRTDPPPDDGDPADDGPQGDDDDAGGTDAPDDPPGDAADDPGASADAVADDPEPPSEDDDADPDDRPLVPSLTDIANMRKPQLVEACRDHELPTHGKVDDLRDRLREALHDRSPDTDDTDDADTEPDPDSLFGNGATDSPEPEADADATDKGDQWILPEMVPDIEAEVAKFDTAESRAYAAWRKKLKLPADPHSWTYTDFDSFWNLIEAMEADR